MIGSLLSLGLAALPAPAQMASEPTATPADWYDAMIRRDTVRRIIDDLPKTPARFRFECGFVQPKPQSFFPQRLCVAAGDQPIADPERLADQARREAARPGLTPEDRLRRAAWLRAMLLHGRMRAEPFETFTVEETVAASDLAGLPVSSGEAERGDIAYTTQPSVRYPPAALRTGTQGPIELRCVIVTGGRLQCETLTSYFAEPLANSDGSAAVPDLLPLVAETHRVAQAMRVAPRTRDDRQSEGLSFIFKIDFRIPE